MPYSCCTRMDLFGIDYLIFFFLNEILKKKIQISLAESNDGLLFCVCFRFHESHFSS